LLILLSQNEYAQKIKKVNQKGGIIKSFFLDNWKSGMFRDTDLKMKMFAATLLFLEAVLGVSAISSSNTLSLVFGLLISKHALVGLYTFSNENSSKFVNFFHSYFTYLVIAAFVAVQMVGNFGNGKFTATLGSLAVVFFIDTLFGLALLVKEYKYEFLSLNLNGKYNYKILKSTFKPTLTREFIFNDATKIQAI